MQFEYDEYDRPKKCPSCGRRGATIRDKDGALVCKCGEVIEEAPEKQD